MPRSERVITVFVASPSDLDTERNHLEEVIQELNDSWSQVFNLRLDLIRWERHAYPDVGEDAQDVLNRELPANYDIFVGLMWGRYGTPTNRAGSGTEEEFNRAYTRFRENADSVKIMFYFKDTPIAPSLLDPEQLAKIQRFRTSLGSEGVLYWTFHNIETFQRLVRIHLTKQIQRFNNSPQSTSNPLNDSPQEEDEDIGFLDLAELVEENLTAVTEIVGRLVTQTQVFNTKLNGCTEEMRLAQNAAAQGTFSRREFKILLEKVASDMDLYADRLKIELPLFRNALNKGADAIARTTLLVVDDQNRSMIPKIRSDIEPFGQALGSAHTSTKSFRDALNSMPQMTATLNRSKRGVLKYVDELLISLGAGHRVILDSVRILNESSNNAQLN